MVKAFLIAALRHFGKNFEFREILKDANRLSAVDFCIIVEQSLKYKNGSLELT